MIRCVGQIHWGSGQFLLCQEPAVALYSFGCVHEHIRPEQPICAVHETESQNVGCVECFKAGHECPMVMRLVRRLVDA